MSRDDGHRIARLDSVTIDCRDPERLARFWATVFGAVEEWRGGEPAQYIDLAATDGIPVLRFQRVPEHTFVIDQGGGDVQLAIAAEDAHRGDQGLRGDAPTLLPLFVGRPVSRSVRVQGPPLLPWARPQSAPESVILANVEGSTIKHRAHS